MSETRYVCPKCDAPMVFRVGKYGEFFGCSKFPKCDGVRNSDGSLTKPRHCIQYDEDTDAMMGFDNYDFYG